jgi:Ca2+-binding RTX toxin-like protein
LPSIDTKHALSDPASNAASEQKMPFDDPATHDINDTSATHEINDNPLTHDIDDDDSVARAGFSSDDTTAGTAAPGLPHAYTGPVSGAHHEYIGITSDHLNIGVSNDDWFIHSGDGDDAIEVHGGTNVLDGGTGSNFLTGGTGAGHDTFFVDDRSASTDIWSTVVHFHAGDDATIWGLTPQDFNIAWSNNQGASGFTGLTLHATAAGKPTASLTLAGFTTDDMNNGRISVTFGHDSASGSSFMNVHANG